MNVSKKQQKALAIIIILIVVAIGIFCFWKSPQCNQENCEECNKGCSSDDNCKFACGCGCISSSQAYDSKGLECEQPPPCYDSCRCIGSQCTNEGSILEEALAKSDLAICDSSTDENCRSYCRGAIENKISQAKMEVSSNKDSYEDGMLVFVSATNKMNEQAYFDGFSVYRMKDGKWLEMDGYERDCFPPFICNETIACETIACGVLEPGESVNWTWNQRFYEEGDNSTKELKASLGRYKIELCYSTQGEPTEGVCVLVGETCSAKEFEIKPLNILLLTSVIQTEGEPITATLENNGETKVSFSPDIIKAVSFDGNYTEVEFIQEHENETHTETLEGGKEHSISIGSQPLGKYRLMMMVNNKIIYSNDFRIVSDKSKFLASEEYCEEDFDCVQIITAQSDCCGGSSGLCVNALSPKVPEPFESGNCLGVFCPSEPILQICKCVNNKCTAEPFSG